MKAPIQTQATQTPTMGSEELAKIAQEQADKQAAIAKEQEAREDKEEKAIDDTWTAFLLACSATGYNVLSRMAVKVGKTVGKAGRPNDDEYQKLTLAILNNKTDFTQQDRLFRLAKKSVRHGIGWTAEEYAKAQDRFIKSKAQGGQGTAGCSLTMAKPAKVAIRLGE